MRLKCRLTRRNHIGKVLNRTYWVIMPKQNYIKYWYLLFSHLECAPVRLQIINSEIAKRTFFLSWIDTSALSRLFTAQL